MKPNAVFTSIVKRPTEDPESEEPTATERKLIKKSVTSPLSAVKTGSVVIAKAPQVSLRQTFVERQGQDDGFFVPKGFVMKNTMFNSTSPRFTYEKDDSVMKEVPGPGSYDST